MCGPNEREIGLCTWKQIGTFCCSNWSRHWITIPQAKYFSVQCQIEPSIIIAYPWVRISPKRRFLLSGWTPDCSLHYLVRILMRWLLVDSFRCCGELCLSGHFCVLFPSPHLHKKSGSLQALKSTQFLFFFLNCSLLCFENKLPVISLPLKSLPLAKMREICLCWAQSSTLQGSAAVWVLPGETVQDGCAIHWWALVQHVRKLELQQFPPIEALICPS